MASSTLPDSSSDYDKLQRLPDVSISAPRVTMCIDLSPPAATTSSAPQTDPLVSPVRSLVSRFEKKQEQNLDALPFRTVRHFFDGDDERSIHVTTEKEKYDALMAKQRAEAEARLLQRSPEYSSHRKRIASAASNVSPVLGPHDPIETVGKNQQKAATPVPTVVRKLVLEFDDESNQNGAEDYLRPEEETAEVDSPPPPPPPPPPPQEEEKVEEPKQQQLLNTPEQETKKRPILTTERSFVMEEDHTIETEDMIVVGERFSTDGEDDREMLMELLDRELHMTPEDEAELRHALETSPSRARMLRRAHRYKRPENVPSKLFAPTAASLASRTTKSPSAAKREPKKTMGASLSMTAPASPGEPKTPTRKSAKYANVQSKVREMMKPSPTLHRRPSDASDSSRTSSRDSMGGKSNQGQSQGALTPSRSTIKASQQNGSVSADRRSSLSAKPLADRRSSLSAKPSSRRSSVNRTLLDIHGDDAHADWEGRHRKERLSFASSTSSIDSTDPIALQLSMAHRKSRYDNVQPRYLDYGKQSATYVRNKEAQQERRRKLEEVNAAKSVDRQKQLQFQSKLKEKRDKEDVAQAVRRGDELHKMSQLLKEKEKEDENERRKSQSATRRALSGTGSVETTPSRARHGTPASSSVGASSPRTSLLSEPDSIPSSATSGATTNVVTAA